MHVRGLLLLLCLLSGSCAHPPLVIEPDTPKMYELIGIHSHDLVCLPDHDSPDLRICATVGAVSVFMHSAHAN